MNRVARALQRPRGSTSRPSTLLLRLRVRLGLVLGLGLISLTSGCSGSPSEGRGLYRASAVDPVVDGVVWEAGNWEPSLPPGQEGFSWGNHRAVVVLEEGESAGQGGGSPNADTAPDMVMVTIPWRRRDADPSSKSLVVVDAATEEPVANALATRIDNASGDVVFQPNPGSDTYYVYYLPWHSSGGYYPTVLYPTTAQLRNAALRSPAGESPSRAEGGMQSQSVWEGLPPLADPMWERRARSAAREGLPRARTTRIQALDAFHSFFPMEIIATPEEMRDFMERMEEERIDDPWALVAEYRDYPIRMKHFLPHHWTERADLDLLSSPVLRDEAFTFQLGLVSGDLPLSDVAVSFRGFPEDWGQGLTCFNCEGIDEKGRRFTRDIDVPVGTVQPLWVGIHIPEDQPAGPVEGTVTVTTGTRGSKSVRVSLLVKPERAREGGTGEPDLMTRLSWLNSTVGTDPDYIIPPFQPIRVEGHSLSVLGRRIELAETGLPAQIFSYFTPELTDVSDQPAPLLARPVALEVQAAGEATPFRSVPFTIRQEARGRARWTTMSSSEHLSMTVEGTLEYEGMLDYRIALVALDDIAVDDIALPVSLLPDAAEYMLGLGRMGGKRPAEVDWKWAVENHQEGVWLGGINKGLQYVLRDENYVRPLNTNFYRNQPLLMPPSWFNGGQGGIRIYEEGTEGASRPDPAAAVTALNYSGPRTLAAGDTLHFNVRFLITPFKPIDTRRHFNTRFVHMYVPVDSVVAWGGTVVNIHHANEINPYINYPFYHLDQQAAYVNEAHEKGIKVKLYYTIRELTYRAYELFALRSFGDEILNDGEGGGHSWLQEHLADHYHSGWHAWRVDDAAILDKGTSRWTNYYVEGLSWLAEHQHIDGLYLDDIAFSRETVKRMVNVLSQERPEVVIDLHSANQFNVRDGFINSAMLYMEHFPFINRLWFGEYFDYDQDPDYWMTEVSGLPFGLMGEMLQDGGHPYRGMLYGMTSRMYGETDPRPVWRMMNDVGIADGEMKGYWLDQTPVRTGDPRILATTFVGPEKTLIALGSWSDSNEVLSLTVDWGALGLGDPAVAGSGRVPARVRVYAPAVEGLQAEADVDLSAVHVPANRGLFVVLEGKAP